MLATKITASRIIAALVLLATAETAVSADEPKPIDWSLIYRYELEKPLGGISDRKADALGAGDFRISFDFDALVGIPGFSGVIDLLGTHGGDPSRRLGDSQSSSNIEAPANTIKVYELWLQEQIAGGKVSLLAGLHDLNSEFYVTDASSLFRNSSFGVGKELAQTGANGPSIFPTTAPAARIRMDADGNWYMQFGVFAAVAGDPENPKGTHLKSKAKDGMLAIWEADYHDDASHSKFGAGLWTYSKARLNAESGAETAKDDGDEQQTATDSGAYLLAERALLEGLAVFLRYGRAESPLQTTESCMTTGIVLQGIGPMRADDKLGLGLATSPDRDQAFHEAESAYELSYRIAVGGGVAIQPDFQLIKHARGDPAAEDLKTGTLRFEWSL